MSALWGAAGGAAAGDELAVVRGAGCRIAGKTSCRDRKALDRSGCVEASNVLCECPGLVETGLKIAAAAVAAGSMG